MFIIRNMPEQKYFADIKPVTATAESPDLSLFNAKINHANNKLHTFLSEKQYLNIKSVGLCSKSILNAINWFK